MSGFRIDDWWSVEYRQQIFNRGVSYNNKRRPTFIAADGHAETQCISDSSYESSSVVNKLLWSNYVDDSKRRRRFRQSTLRRRQRNRI